MKNSRAITTKRFFTALALLLPLPALAQSIYVYPSTAAAPRGSYQTVTAVVTGVNNKTVTWNTTGGTLVGTNPCVVNEPCTIAVHDTTAETDTLTATTNVGTVVATSTLTFTASPTATTGHPRLYVTAGMLPALQAKATSSNTIYQTTVNYATAYMYNVDKAAPISWGWTSWNGSACAGGTGLPANDQSGNDREQDANQFAWLSMVAATSAQRNTWGCAGRDTFTYMMNQVLAGHQNIIGNNWSDGALDYTITADWLMAGGYLSPADITLTRRFFAYFAQQILGPNGNNGYVPPITGYNSSSLFNVPILSGGSAIGLMREMGNNYTMSRIMALTVIGLTFDDNATDDPATTNTCGATRYQVCPDYSAGSLHAYWNYVDGSMLYLMYAHLEDPTVTWPAYQAAYANLPTQPTCLYTTGAAIPCFGDGRGGESSEGSWYGYSLYRLRYMLNMLYTAGYNDPLVWGPQVSLATSSWWDLKRVSDLEFITGFNQSNGGVGGNQPSYGYLTTGDTNTYFRVPGDFQTETSLMVFDTYTGRTDRLSALEWPVLNTAFGGPQGTTGNCSGHCGFDNFMMWVYANSLTPDLMISLPAADPVASLPPDPRPSLPLDLYNGSFNQHQMVRNNWTSPTLFSFSCNNSMINHEHEWCGKFEIYANGEYITKGRTAFTDNYSGNNMVTAQSSNELFLANQLTNGSGGCTDPGCPPNGGGQFDGTMGVLNPSGLLHSELPAYAADIVDSTGFYNGFWAWSSPYDVPTYDDVTAASRSLIYLRGTNQVVFYDRGTTSHAGAKGVYQTITGTPTISGNVASWPTRSAKQKAYLTTLLPSGATLSNNGLPCAGCSSDQPNDWEPAAQLQVAAAGTPTSTQFLTVMEWGATSLAKSPTTLVESSAGQNFDGALVASSLVMFMRNWPTAFTSTTYPASGATTQYISDLAPNTTYNITGAGAPPTATTDTAGVLTFPASGAGDITIRAVARIGSTPKIASTTKIGLPVLCGAAVLAASIILPQARNWYRHRRTTS